MRRLVATLALALSLATPAVLAATSASAAPTHTAVSMKRTDYFTTYMEEYNQQSQRVAAPDLSIGADVVTNTSGRIMDMIAVGNSYKIEFDADTSKCVKVPVLGGGVVVGTCAGNGYLWTWESNPTGNGSFVDNNYTKNNGFADFYLGGGTNTFLNLVQIDSGAFKKWTLR